MNAKIHQQLVDRKSRIERRLGNKRLDNLDQPMFTAANIHYEIADRTRGLAHGGIGAMHLLARRVGLIDAINERLHLLKIHLLYHESDHVLNLESNWAYMVMTALAWNLKAWFALWPTEGPGRHIERHQKEKQTILGMEFKTFINAFLRLPCQIASAGRRLVYRVLGWNPWQRTFFRTLAQMRC